MRLRVGVAGSGFGAAHIAAYKALPGKYEVGAICDIDMERARRLGSQEGIPCVTRDFGALCAQKDLDIIDVCTPSHLHAQHTMEALAAGKHVICEKPIAGSLRDIDGLIDAEAGCGRRVMPIFQNRFGAGIQKLRMLLDQGIAGRPYLATATTAWRRRPAYYAVPWRGKWDTEMGGSLVTLGIHTIDLILHVLGPASSAFAFAATRVNPVETEDCLSACLRMADGSLCSYGLTTGSSRETSKLRICFEGFSAESNDAPYAYSSDPWTFVGDSERHTERIVESLQSFSPEPEGLEGQFSAFHTALDAGSEIPVTLRSARHVLETVTAIYASAHAGKLVELPIASDDPCYASWRP